MPHSWMDDASGNFISSTYYMTRLPEAVEKFNKEKNIEKFLNNNWNTLYPVTAYIESETTTNHTRKTAR